MSHVADFLAGLPLFEGMSGLEVAAVAAFLESRRFAAGETVFREGETGSELYIVRSGRIGSYVTLPDGSRREVYDFGPGLLFGEMAIIESEPRSATCYAREASELLVLEGLDFYRLVWEHPVIGVKLLASIARVMVAWLDEASSFLGG
ncbi:MAG: cyclic nucleotide-binding domain-containing protein, partial [Spirochaetaceae bacterium]|nr:cyclic nucleotide-binding domain-containing protein [Spirochaetaceae bacterium]